MCVCVCDSSGQQESTRQQPGLPKRKLQFLQHAVVPLVECVPKGTYPQFNAGLHCSLRFTVCHVPPDEQQADNDDDDGDADRTPKTHKKTHTQQRRAKSRKSASYEIVFQSCCCCCCCEKWAARKSYYRATSSHIHTHSQPARCALFASGCSDWCTFLPFFTFSALCCGIFLMLWRERLPPSKRWLLVDSNARTFTVALCALCWRIESSHFGLERWEAFPLSMRLFAFPTRNSHSLCSPLLRYRHNNFSLCTAFALDRKGGKGVWNLMNNHNCKRTHKHTHTQTCAILTVKQFKPDYSRLWFRARPPTALPAVRNDGCCRRHASSNNLVCNLETRPEMVPILPVVGSRYLCCGAGRIIDINTDRWRHMPGRQISRLVPSGGGTWRAGSRKKYFRSGSKLFRCSCLKYDQIIKIKSARFKFHIHRRKLALRYLMHDKVFRQTTHTLILCCNRYGICNAKKAQSIEQCMLKCLIVRYEKNILPFWKIII